MRTFTKTMMLLVAMLLGVTTNVSADPDLNDYTLVRSVEWGGDVDVAISSTALKITAYETGNAKQQAIFPATAPEDAVGWVAVQAVRGSGTKGWQNLSGKGLYSYNASRSGAVYGDDLTTGWLVIFECTQDASKVMTLINGGSNPDGPFSFIQSDDKKSYICTITGEKDAYVGFCGSKSAGYIKRISVYKPNKEQVVASYTVKYVDTDGNELKNAVTYNGIAGNIVALTGADKANIKVEDTYYLYDHDDAADNPIAEDGSTVITVVFRQANNFNYFVTERAGDIVFRTTGGTNYESAKVTSPYRRYNTKDGILYRKDAISKEYNYYFTLASDNQQEFVDYTALDINNVVFLSEGEDIKGMTICNSANTGIRSSNSSSGFPKDGDVAIATLTPGTYKIVATIYDASKSPDSHWIFKAGETEVADLHCTTVNIQELTSGEFTLTENTTIYLAQGGSNTMGLDVVYITGDGAVVEEPVIETIAFEIKDSEGYATYFNSQKAFKMPEGVKGGIVKAAEGQKAVVDFVYEAGDVVPAASPIILLGEQKAYDAEIVESTETPIADNLLRGYDEATEKQADNDDFYFYKLSRSTVNGEKKLGFFWFSADGHTNGSEPNKAYLCLPASQGAGYMILFDESTGIETAQQVKSDNGAIYTLTGIRVNGSQVVKGIYIQNGRTFIVK